jgi:hypothetical protein
LIQFKRDNAGGTVFYPVKRVENAYYSGMAVYLKICCGLALPFFCGPWWRDFFLRTVWQVVLTLPLAFSLTDSARAAETPAPESRNEFPTYRLTEIPSDAKKGLGSWIWTDKTFDHQVCRLWKGFDIPKDTKVVEARMRIAVDDGYQMYLDGRELSQGANWRSITEYDLTLLMTPGRHVLAINAFNDYYAAGMLMDFRVVLADGRVVDIKSDESWKVVPEGVRNWEKLKRSQSGGLCQGAAFSAAGDSVLAGRLVLSAAGFRMRIVLSGLHRPLFPGCLSKEGAAPAQSGTRTHRTRHSR